ASVAEQARMVAEGVRLAKARGVTFAGLIKHDPQAAVDALLPYALRKVLPPEVAEAVEHPVRGRGPLDVIGVTPAPGQSVEEPIVRKAKLNDQEYRADTYGTAR